MSTLLESCKEYCRQAAELNNDIEILQEKGVSPKDIGYRQVYRTRVNIRNLYKDTYLKYIRSEYQDKWKSELMDRYHLYKEQLKSMNPGFDRQLFIEEYKCVSRLTLEYKLRISNYASRKKGKKHRSIFKNNLSDDVIDGIHLSDTQMYTDWRNGEYDDSEHQLKQSIIMDELNKLTPKQRRVAELVWIQGMNQTSAARALGINKSTISRDLKRARFVISQDMRNAVISHRRYDPIIIDLANPSEMKNISEMFSRYQELLLMLYVGDGWSLYDLGEIFHRNKSSMNRTLRRILCRILNYAKSDTVILHNFEKWVDYVSGYWMKYIEDNTFYEHLKTFSHSFQGMRSYDYEFKSKDIGLRQISIRASYFGEQKKSKLSYAIANYYREQTKHEEKG